MATILLLNGPNLNLLGQREPERYGHDTLASITETLSRTAADAGHRLESYQSNAEHQLIDRIHACRTDGTRWILFNPGAFTHTSIALRDALLAVAVPFVEVHLSNVHAREPFRHRSHFSDIASGTLVGFGALGYELALAAVLRRLQADPTVTE